MNLLWGSHAVVLWWRAFVVSVCPLWAGGDEAGYEVQLHASWPRAVCFLERVGMPDAKAIAAEQGGTDMLADGGDG